jgi:hypothetical protein
VPVPCDHPCDHKRGTHRAAPVAPQLRIVVQEKCAEIQLSYPYYSLFPILVLWPYSRSTGHQPLPADRISSTPFWRRAAARPFLRHRPFPPTEPPPCVHIFPNSIDRCRCGEGCHAHSRKHRSAIVSSGLTALFNWWRISCVHGPHLLQDNKNGT